MIKSLFDYDDEEKPQPKETTTETAESEESIKRQLEEMNLGAPETPAAANDETETITQIRPAETGENFDANSAADDADDEIETVTLPRIEQVYANAGEPSLPANSFSENQLFEAETRAAESELPPPTSEPLPPPVASTPTQYRNVLQNENAPANEGAAQNQNTFQTENVSQTGSIFQNENASRSEPQSLTTAETLRQSGMAWSAAIGLFGSILFMMILGWFFDLLTDASPFGIVVGIIIGAGIGFYQFFRMTSQIFKK